MHIRYWKTVVFVVSTVISIDVLCEFRPSGSIGVGLGIDDNAYRTGTREESKKSDVRRDLYFSLGLDHYSSFYSLDANYIGRKSSFRDDSQETNTSVNGISRLTFFNSKKNISWYFEDRETETIRDILEVDIESNRQRRTILSTGPSMFWKVGERDKLTLEGIYSDVSVDNDGISSERITYGASWMRNFSTKLEFGLSYDTSEIKVDENSSLDYTRRNASIIWNRKINLGSIRLNAGLTEIEKDIQIGSVNSPSISLIIDRQKKGISTSLAVKQALTDRSVGTFGLKENTSIENLEDFGVDGLDIVVQKSVTLAHSRKYNDSSATLSVKFGYAESDFSDTSRVDERSSASIIWLQNMSRKYSYQISLRYLDSNLEELAVSKNSKQTSIRLRINRSFGKRLSGTCGLHIIDRDSEIYESNQSNVFNCRLNMSFP